MMQIDSGLMYSAIARTLDGPQQKAFLNRSTGQIVFIPSDEGEAEAWYGAEAAIDIVFDRAAVESSPEEWIQIPKYDREIVGRDREDEFIAEFLKKQGIEAELK